MRTQTARIQNSNSRSHLPQRFFLALVMLVCIALPTAAQTPAEPKPGPTRNAYLGKVRQAHVPGGKISTSAYPRKGTGVKVNRKSPSGDGGCDAGLTVSISGVSLATGCIPDCAGLSNNVSFTDLGFNTTVGPFPVISTLADWCDSSIEGCIYVWEDIPLIHSTLSFNADCSDPDYSGDTGVAIIVLNTGGVWYVWIYNSSVSPIGGCGFFLVPLELFYGSTTDVNTPISNVLTNNNPCSGAYSRSGVLPDIWWGNCSPGSGTDCWAPAGSGGTVTINPSASEEDTKPCDRKEGGDQGGGCSAMARYSAHAMLASLNIEDTPVRYSPARGPAIDFTVTYNQRETQQPQAFTYSNLGAKWTFNWLSYVIDNPNDPSANAVVYVPGGGAENYSGFDPNSQSYAPDPQSHTVLVRTSSAAYEKRFPDGSKQVFDLSNGPYYGRKIFMTRVIDAAGNPVTIGYDPSFRIVTLTDALGYVTTLSYEDPDPLKITKVRDPFGRFAIFNYTNGQLTRITDPVGIQSQFSYQSGTDFINALTTPYGTSHFATGVNGTNRWIEMTDPRGGIERVEFKDGAIGGSEPVAPPGFTNSALDVANTFYWDKKYTELYPPGQYPYDYTKAKLIHWAKNSIGSVSGIAASEKAPLENRVWYAYAGQIDTNHTGSSASPIQIARVLDDGTTTKLWQFQYNDFGYATQSTDPVGRRMSYDYDTNKIDLLRVRQTTGSNNELLRSLTYNSFHEPLTDTDAAGQRTGYTYNAYGQMLIRKNAKSETTTFAYGGTVPDGYLASITGPQFNGNSAVTSFTYDAANRVRTVTDSDGYTVTTDYDNLDRQTQITYPDGTNRQFQYTQDFGQGLTTILDLTKSKDRRGLWTTRHYNANRQMDSITDPQQRTTLFGWCTCGSLVSITDPKQQPTTFDRDLQSRVTRKNFADTTFVSYAYENTTSRLHSMTDALNQRTNYQYFADDNVQQVSYTNTVHTTPTVGYTYDSNYNRVRTMTDGTGATTYAYKPITAPPPLGAGQLASIDGPLANDTITFGYDQLGRVTNRSINGPANSATWTFDSLGRMSSVANKLGTFSYSYVNVTSRLRGMTYPGGSSSVYTYFPNAQDKRLQEIKNNPPTATNPLFSQFDYTYDVQGEILTWTKNYPGLSPAPQRSDLGYDNADQLLTAPLKKTSGTLIKQYTYGYDVAANRTSELVGTVTTTSTPNNVNEITSQSGGTNRTLTYDPNGSLTNDGLGRTFEWDGANRLTAINYANGRSEFTYDGLNRCVKIVEIVGLNPSTRKFVWCDMERCEFRDVNDAVTLFVYPQGQYSGTTPYFYSRDHLGSIREMFKSNGTVVARYDYDPWGRSTAVINTTLPDFNFTGLYRHSPSNLDFAVYRAYDPDLGRWINRDPLDNAEVVQGPNLYAYVRNNPVNVVDIDGRTGSQFIECLNRCLHEFDPLPGSAKLCLLGLGPWPKPFVTPGSTPYTNVPRRFFGLKGLGRSCLVKYVTIPAAIVYGDYLAGVEVSCAIQCGINANAF